MADMWDFLINKDKREVPCDTCEFSKRCETTLEECVAMRNWQHTGDYKDKDVARLRRVMKNYK